MQTSITLTPEERVRIESAVAAYVTAHKRWEKEDFRIDYKGIRNDQAVVWAVYLEDELHPRPGAGKSIELHVNVKTFDVEKELSFQ